MWVWHEASTISWNLVLLSSECSWSGYGDCEVHSQLVCLIGNKNEQLKKTRTPLWLLKFSYKHDGWQRTAAEVTRRERHHTLWFLRQDRVSFAVGPTFWRTLRLFEIEVDFYSATEHTYMRHICSYLNSMASALLHYLEMRYEKPPQWLQMK